MFSRPLATKLSGDAVLHVCVMISNPVRFASRYKLLELFKSQVDAGHIKLWIVEVAYGNRPFVVTERDNPQHLQLRTAHEIWHKENALNLLMAQVISVCPEAEYLAWIDADVTFARADWAYETLQQLQHFDMVQMFSQAQDVGPKFEPIGNKMHTGFVYAYFNDPEFNTTEKRYGYSSDGHPGYAWAARRSALDTIGGLFDVAICGGADRHMACAMIGTVDNSTPDRKKTIDELSPNFRKLLYIYQDRALGLHKNVGYVDGLLVHHWHGRKADRKYGDRWRIYIDNEYDPLVDLVRDTQGLYQLSHRSPKLRDDLRSYMRARNEDSIEVPE